MRRQLRQSRSDEIAKRLSERFETYASVLGLLEQENNSNEEINLIRNIGNEFEELAYRHQDNSVDWDIIDAHAVSKMMSSFIVRIDHRQREKNGPFSRAQEWWPTLCKINRSLGEDG